MSSFKLFHLPRLAYEHIIKLMAIEDIFCLSCCSKKVTRLLKDMRMEVEAVHIHYGDRMYVQIDRTYIPYYERCFVVISQVNHIKHIKSAKSRLYHDWFRRLKYLTMNSFEDLIRFSDHVQSVFNIKKFEIGVDWEERPKKKMNKFLWIALAKKYDCVAIFILESIEPRFFNWLMKTVNLNASLRMHCPVPEHCQHENKLRFKSIEYYRAEWVTLHDLKSIRNLDSVTLEGTKLTCADLNKFLHFWVNSEHDMMKRLSVGLPIKSVIDQDCVFKDIIRVTLKQSEGDLHYILARRHPEKKFTIGEIKLKSITMELTAFESSEIFPYMISSLECLEKKNSLKKEKIEVERDESAFSKNWTQYTVGDFDQMIKKMRNRKEDIDKELEAIQQKLVQLGIVDFDGSGTVV